MNVCVNYYSCDLFDFRKTEAAGKCIEVFQCGGVGFYGMRGQLFSDAQMRRYSSLTAVIFMMISLLAVMFSGRADAPGSLPLRCLSDYIVSENPPEKRCDRSGKGMRCAGREKYGKIDVRSGKMNC